MERYARQAAIEARRHLRTWQAIARMVSRNPKVKLQLTSGPSRTDGTTVWLKVPIELGMKPEHDRSLCGYRDDLLVQECAACAIHEEVFVTIVHEMAHLLFGTFAPATDRERIEAIRKGIALETKGKPEGSRAKKIQKQIDQIPKEYYGQYMALASMISPYLPLVVNALEDTRVNMATEAARKGLRVMFTASHAAMLQRGIKVGEDEVRFLKDAQPNLQAISVVFFESSGIPWEPFVSDEVREALDDERFRDLCEQAAGSRSVKEVFTLAIPVLERLRELGFLLSPDDEEDDPEPESDDGGEGESDEGTSGDTSNESPEDSSDSDGDNGGGDSPSGGGGGGDDGDKDNEKGDQGGDGNGNEPSDGESSDSDSGTGSGDGSGDPQAGEPGQSDAGGPDEAASGDPAGGSDDPSGSSSGQDSGHTRNT